MEYNTQRPQMVIPEYGRHIQKMVEFACTVKDRDERNKVANAIIKVMGQLNPHLRDVDDFNHKLWAHLFIISDFKLEVDSPYPIPEKGDNEYKPERLNYPGSKLKYRYYGETVMDLINKAKEYPEGDEKNVLVGIIANLMKRFFLTWNRDSVEDDLIVSHLDELGEGKLKLQPGFQFTPTSEILAKIGPTQKPTRQGGKKRKKKRR